MADIKDNFGRNVPTSGMAPDELKGMISSLMKKNVETKKTYGSEKANKDQEKMLKALDQFKDFRNELAQIKKILAKTGNGRKKDQKPTKNEAKYFKSMEKFTAHGLKKGSIYVHDVYVESQLKALAKAFGAKGGRVPRGFKKNDLAGDGSGGINKRIRLSKPIEEDARFDLNEKQGNAAGRAGNFASKRGDEFLGIDIDGTLFQGLIKEEQLFRQNVKALAFETDGVTASMGGLQKEFADIAYTTDRTGVNVSKFQKQYLKNLTIGLKSYKEAKKLTETQLYSERQLGLEAGSLEQTYEMMAVELRLSNVQIMSISKGMQSVAKSTGLTGQEMAEVVKASEEFMKNMSDTGKVTSEAVTNMMRLAAESQKLGVGNKSKEFTKGLTDSAALFTGELEENMQSLMFRAADKAGLGKALRDQTIGDSREQLSQLAKSIEKTAAQQIGLKDLSKDTVENLSGQNKLIANIRAKNMGFTGVGELQKFVEAQKRASMSFVENLQEVTKEEEKARTASQRLAAQKKKEGMIAEQSMSIITAANEGKLKAEKKNEYIAGMQKAGVKIGSDASNEEVTAKALETAIKDLNKNRSEAGLKKLKLEDKISGAVGGGTNLAELTEAIQNGQKELDTQLKDNLDPVTKTNRLLEEGNAILRDMSSGFLGMFSDIFGTLGTLAIAASSLVSSGLLKSFDALKDLENLGDFIDKILNVKSAKAATASMGDVMAGKASNPAAHAAIPHGKGKYATMFSKAEEKLAYFTSSITSKVGGGLSKLGSALKPFAGTLAVVTGVVVGVVSGFKAMESAGEIFNKSLKDLTENEKSAAFSAGALTGILNFLTFGIFDNLFGATGSLTIALAKFFDIFKPAMFIVTVVRKALETMWNIIKGIALGIWEIISGIWDGIVEIMKPINEVFDAVWDAIKAIMYPFELLGEMFGFVGGETSFIVESFKALGKAIGWVFKIIGKVIGFIVRVIVEPLKGLANFITGIFTFDMKKILSGLTSMFLALPKVLWQTFKGIFSNIGTFALDALKAVFIDFPIMLMGWMYDGITNALKAVVDWVLSFIPGSKGFSGDAAANDKRREEEGSSFFNGIGATLGGIVDLDLEKTIDGIGETIVAPFAAVGGWLSSLNPFATGTKEIKNSGAAFLHAGEAVIPADIAQGSGEFMEKDMMKMLTSPLNGMLGMVDSMFGTGLSEIFNSESGMPKMLESLFMGDPEQSMEASKIQPSSVSSGSELSIISEASLRQVELMEVHLAVLERIESILSDNTSRSSSNPHSGVDVNIIPSKPARYYNMPIGKYDQGSAAQVTNN